MRSLLTKAFYASHSRVEKEAIKFEPANRAITNLVEAALNFRSLAKTCKT